MGKPRSSTFATCTRVEEATATVGGVSEGEFAVEGERMWHVLICSAARGELPFFPSRTHTVHKYRPLSGGGDGVSEVDPDFPRLRLTQAKA